MNTENSPGTTRRDFLRTTGALGAGLVATGSMTASGGAATPPRTEALALNGGPRTVTAATPAATHWPAYGEEEIALVSRLLRQPGYGPVAEFEEAWKAHFNCTYAKAHCNGTSALTAMLFALDAPEGSEVIVPDYSTWFPVVPMRFFGLVPVFVDVDPRTLNLEVEACRKALTPRTRAIMPVHWYGLPCDLDALGAFADEHGLAVLEDASHAHGAKLKDVWIGNWGRMAGFSLQSTKPLPAIEGGIAMFKDRFDFERAVTYGNYDLPHTFPADSPYRKYQGTAFGSKLRIHPIAAILARIQLRDLDRRNREGVAQMARLNARLTQLPGLETPYCRPDVSRVYYSKNLLFVNERQAGVSREALVKALAAEGVDVSPYTWTLLHTYPIFSEDRWWRHLPVLPSAVPGCDEANRKTIQLPYFTSEQPELVEQYARAFEKVWAHRRSLG